VGADCPKDRQAVRFEPLNEFVPQHASGAQDEHTRPRLRARGSPRRPGLIVHV
jgi:hypothetical protein